MPLRFIQRSIPPTQEEEKLKTIIWHTDAVKIYHRNFSNNAVPDLNENNGDRFAEKMHRLVDLHTPIHPSPVNMIFLLHFSRLCANKNCSYSKDDIQSVGRIYLFQFTLTGSLQPLTTITGHKTFMKLGSSLAVGNPYSNSFVNKDNDMLAVSAMTLSKILLLACLVVLVSDWIVK